MRAARLVTYCFLYYSAVLLLNNLLAYGVQFSIESLANYGLAVVIAFFGSLGSCGPMSKQIGPPSTASSPT